MRRGEPPERMRALRYAPLTAPTTSTDPTWPPAEGLSFGLLGPVRAWRDADPVATGSPQQRALLACLLLRGGRTATAAELIDAIWGAEPPSQALAAVRTYASRLRKLLGPETLLSKNGGYALRLSPGMLDLHAARDLVSESEQAQDRGDLRRARELLTQSLVLWAGEALTGLPGPYAETERVQLEEWRLQLLERRLDMDLQEGAHAEVVPELTTHTAAHPLRERLRELLMLALYRSGRQAEALAVYADTRRVLADELGIDPSPALQQLQERILTAEDSLLAVPSSRPEPPPATPVRPSQLPATVPDFTGRAALVRELGHTLTHADDPAVAVAALAGIGGVGKTTLAVHVAHEVRPHFPDGQLYVDLQGAGPGPTDPPAVLGAFLRALGTPDSAIASDVAERAAQFRAALDGRRILVLLDNARDAAQVRPLLPGTPGCAALVTSRGRMADLPGTHLVDLDAMSPEEALLLFTRIAGKERISTERAAALEVVAACGFLPLAIRIAASRLAAHRTWTVTTLAAKLADEHRRLDELQAGDLAVKAAFELGYGQLEADQARAFRLLSLADGPDISLTAAAAVLDLAPHRTDDLLEALVDTSLLESASPGRYRYHNLVRLFARACVERDERPSATGEMALSRLLDFYLSTAALAYSTERPGDRLVDHLEATAYRGLTFADSGAAQNWLYTEADCLLACVRQSAEASRLSRAVDLLWVAQDLSESGTHSGPYASAAEALRTAAATAGDLRTMARTALIQAEAEMPLGRFAMARDGAEQALRWASRDTPVECRAASLLGVIALYQSRYDDADRHLTDALHAFRSASDRPGEASALGNLSRVRAAQGDSAGAITLAQEAMDIYDSLGLSLRGANARYALGLALTQAGRHEEANAALYEARNVFRTSHQPLWEGMALFRSAEADLAAGHPRHAAAHAEESLERIGESGGQWRRGNILVVLGRALHAMEQTARARTCWEEALSIFEELGSNEAEQVRDLLGDTVTSSHNGSD
ncbi:BTAD domain-containing putative transcriptional regulator [Streptomyces sp. NPDC002463]|uniref:AfsR/SARP family transcriptional regulator n=1 Tax=Streptomyces sp. NPDC002463 TaxID=3364645 RepID=UPI003689DC0E